MDTPNPLPPEPSTPDLAAEINAWFFASFGWTGLIVIAVASSLIYVWRNWEELQKLPGIRFLVNRPTQQPIPRADPAQFSILVARLEHDSNDEQHRLVLQTLSEFAGIQVLALDRQIAPEAADAGAAERFGHDQARSYLVVAQAQVVLWGTVLKQGERSLPKLYWTAAPTTRLSKHSDRYPANQHDLRLPELFWQDLTAVLGTVALIQASEFDAQRGTFVADRLQQFINKLRTLLSPSAAATPWPPETRVRIQTILADALTTYGEQAGNNTALQEAVDTYKELVLEDTRERVPLDWAMTQNSLGLALWRLGARESDTARLDEAVSAYCDALLEYTRERVPLDWATTQNNLGLALQTLGERESSTARLDEAVAAYRNALLEYTRECLPLDWAMIQNNLGSVLSTLGERENDTARLGEAVAAYRAALLERTRERVPLSWAMTQNNLGNALSTLGEIESGTMRLDEAVVAYRAALLEQTRERVPLYWAGTQNNLGNALQILGERENDTARLDEAVAAYYDALLERTRERVPLDWAMTQNNLGNALRTLGVRRRDAVPLCAALEHHLAALEVFAADSPHYANMARAGVAADLEALKTGFDSSDSAACLARHQKRIDRLMVN